MKTLTKYKIGEICYVTDYVANGSFASLKENVKYLKNDGYAILVRLTDFTKQWEGPFVYISKSAYEFLKKSSLQTGDLIMSNVGDTGKVFILPELYKPASLGPNSILIRPNETIIDKEYLYYYFISNVGQLQIKKISSGTTQSKFNKTAFRAIIITIPPLQEQKQIVSKIKQLFTLLDKSEEKLKQSEEKLKNILDSSLLTIQNKEGEIYPLKDIVTIQKETIKLEPQQKSFYIALEDIEANTGKLLNQRYVTGNEIKSTKLKFNTNHVLYSRLRPYLNKVVIPPEQGICVTDLLPLLPNEKVTQKYLYYYLRSPQIRNYINQKMTGIKMPRLRAEDLNNMPIFVPSVEIQNNFVTKTELLSEMAYRSEISIRKQMETLAQLRQSILKKAFEGRLNTNSTK